LLRNTHALIENHPRYDGNPDNAMPVDFAQRVSDSDGGDTQSRSRHADAFALQQCGSEQAKCHTSLPTSGPIA
jgi:hypothetical protein